MEAADTFSSHSERPSPGNGSQSDRNTTQIDRSSHDLTPFHLAVLANDYAKVRKIARDREHGIEARTATGTTAYMLAALYGRIDIFLFLTLKKASPHNKDFQGNSALDYVKQDLPFVKDLIQEYKKFATRKPDQAGRRHIYGVLKARQRDIKIAYAQGRADARAEAQTQAQVPAQAEAKSQAETQAQGQLQTVMDVDRPNAQQIIQDPLVRLVFLRSVNGKQQEVGEFRPIATAEHGYIGRKCTGFIYAADENDSPKLAVSGWGRVEDKNVVFRNVLDNKQYTELVKRVAALLGFELEANWLDHKFPGTASEKKGAFVACHAEKQLAVFILVKALSRVFGTGSITIQNINQLKTQLNTLPPNLREATIHLDHEKVCSNCVKFLQLLRQKTGLVLRCQSHDWYIYGERPQLEKKPDGSCMPVMNTEKYSGPNDGAAIFEDEIGVFDTSDSIEIGLQCDSVIHESDSLMLHDDADTLRTPSNHRCGLTQQQALSKPPDHGSEYRRGSPVAEEPEYDSSRYHPPNVTPPSKDAQALQTPQSHTRLNDAQRVTISPSPAGPFSAFGLHTDSISPSVSQEWEVEEILQFKEENGVREFLVKWKGYPHDNDTWEPESNLTNASVAITKFWEELHASQSRNQDAGEASRYGLTGTVYNTPASTSV